MRRLTGAGSDAVLPLVGGPPQDATVVGAGPHATYLEVGDDGSPIWGAIQLLGAHERSGTEGMRAYGPIPEAGQQLIAACAQLLADLHVGISEADTYGVWPHGRVVRIGEAAAKLLELVATFEVEAREPNPDKSWAVAS